MAIKKEYKSHLNVKFDFKQDVAPKDYYPIGERLEIPKSHFNYTFLSRYLINKEGLEVAKNYGNDFCRDKKRKISIRFNKKKLTLELSISSENPLSEDELLNVKNLENFILTGEYPEE